jgi:signal transduction histidine kinase
MRQTAMHFRSAKRAHMELVAPLGSVAGFWRALRCEGAMSWFATLYEGSWRSRCAIGAAAAASGELWRLAIMEPFDDRLVYVTFFPSVELAAVLGGFGAGVLAACFSAVLAHVWHAPLTQANHWLGLGIFLASCVVVSAITELLHRTRLRLGEAEARRADKERLDSMGGMAAALAHELNQPLAATGTYLNVARRLLKKPPEQRSSSVEEALECAARQIVRAGEIVSSLREMVAHGEPDKTMVDLHELIQASLEPLLSYAQQTRVRVDCRFDAPTDRLLADRVQIKQVLANLIRNAIDAMQSSKTRVLLISTSATAGAILVTIVDTGQGLSAETAADLFKPFKTTKAKGMGVGLSISRSIIEAHYGKIWGEPDPGGGARFGFTLPLVEGDEA